MLRITRYAALLGPMILSSATLMNGRVALADPGSLAIGSSDSVEHAKPEAGGRAFKRIHAAVDAGPAWRGSLEQNKPEAGGRVIHGTADAGPAWTGSSAQNKPEAGGRVFNPANQVADEGATSQKTSAVACTTEPNEAKRC